MDWTFGFGKKDEAPLPKKWIGSITAAWVGSDAVAVYNLFVDEKGGRTCEAHGTDADKHTLYLTRIYPWLQGGKDELLVNELETSDVDYWKPAKAAVHTAPKPARKAAKK